MQSGTPFLKNNLRAENCFSTSVFYLVPEQFQYSFRFVNSGYEVFKLDTMQLMIK